MRDRRRCRGDAGAGVARQQIPGAWWWAVANPPGWALGWFVTSYVIARNIDEQFPNFGASGVVVFALLTWPLLAMLFRETAPKSERNGSPRHFVTVEPAAGVFLILLPLAFNASFFLLGRRFDYPNILRRPTDDILPRFQAGGVGLKLLWYGFMLTAVLFARLPCSSGQVFAPDGIAVIPTATVVGVLAAAVQFLGLARWPFLVRH